MGGGRAFEGKLEGKITTTVVPLPLPPPFLFPLPLPQDHFSFAQWDAEAARVTGLTLMSGPGGYGRNYTLLGQMGARDTQ